MQKIWDKWKILQKIPSINVLNIPNRKKFLFSVG